MRTTLIIAAAGMLAAGASVAQPAPRQHVWTVDDFWRGAPDGPRERLQFMQARIDRGLADRSLDRREAALLNQKLDDLRQFVRQVHRDDKGPFTRDERARVEDRFDGLAREIHSMRNNGR